MKVLVAYDGTIKAKEALRYGIKRAKEEDGRLVALYVFSSGTLAGYDSIPQAREMVRGEVERHIEEARDIVREEATGIWARVVAEEGNPDDETLEFASEWLADLLLCPPHMRSVIKRYKELLADSGMQTREDEVIDKDANPRMAVRYPA